MAAYGFVLCAYVYDLLDIGLIGRRGKVILAMIGVAMLLAWFEGPLGWLGLGLGVATVLGVRRAGEWLRWEGGWQTLGVAGVAGLSWLARYVGDMVRRLCEVFSPAPREDLRGPVIDAQPATPVRGDTAYANHRQMRWTPGWTPDGWADDTAVTPVPVPEGLHSVETYTDWLPGSVERHGGFNAAAREAAGRWGISRSTFARDMRRIREAA